MKIYNTINLTRKSDIKELLGKYGAKPEKYLGQHFILSKKALALMVGAAEINPDARGRGSDPDARSGSRSGRRLRKRRRKTDIIVEIGPGLGTLTQRLAVTGAKVIAIEKDSLMISILEKTMANYQNVKIIQADARQILIPRINNVIDSRNQYKIVANLPYNIATFLIREWLGSKNPPKMMVLMIQKEVARRIVAKPPHSNLLGISVQFYADAEIIDYIKKESFWPRPKVDAAIIKVIPKIIRGNGRIQLIDFKRSFFKAVKAGFSQPRKQLAGNLSKKLNIPKEKLILIFQNLNIPTTARAENLTLEQWRLLANNFYSFSRGNKINF